MQQIGRYMNDFKAKIKPEIAHTSYFVAVP